MRVPCCLSWAIWSYPGNDWYLLSLHQTIQIALLYLSLGKGPDLSKEALSLLIIYSFYRRKRLGGYSQSYYKWIKAEWPNSQEGVNTVYFLPATQLQQQTPRKYHWQHDQKGLKTPRLRIHHSSDVLLKPIWNCNFMDRNLQDRNMSLNMKY